MSSSSNLKQLVATHLHHSFDDRVILDDVSVSIRVGERIGLVGKNGSGKSTLLKIFVGLQKSDKGTVSKGRVRVGYVPQQQSPSDESQTVETLLISGDGISVHKRNSERLLGDLDFEKPLSTPVAKLSGGERMRVAIAKSLLNKPDILLLDEPTNHLDLQGKRWLVDFLRSWSGGFVVVSHDRAFLDDVAEEVWELLDGKIRVFGGNYSFYKENIEAERVVRDQEVARTRGEVRNVKRRAQREQERIAHGKRRDIGNNAKDHDRFQAGFFKEHAQKSAGKKKLIHEERIGTLEKELSDFRQKRRAVVNARFVEAETGGRKLLVSFDDCSIGYEHPLIEHATFEVRQGDRVAVFGKNGSGKTTFMKALIGDATARVDGNVRRNESFQFHVLDQTYSNIDSNRTVWEHVVALKTGLDDVQLRDHLARFLFREHADIQKIGSELSGGETARLALALIALEKVELLILDEPTNNLDISAIEQIESALQEFSGALLVVSHDLAFLRNIGIERMYEICDRRLVELSEFPR